MQGSVGWAALGGQRWEVADRRAALRVPVRSWPMSERTCGNKEAHCLWHWDDGQQAEGAEEHQGVEEEAAKGHAEVEEEAICEVEQGAGLGGAGGIGATM